MSILRSSESQFSVGGRLGLLPCGAQEPKPGIDRERSVRRPVSRVLSRSLERGHGRPFIWDARCRTPRATYPGGAAETPSAAPILFRGPAGRPPLCGLAPGGVYPAAAVTGGAVRSYRTISPLPASRSRERPAGC